MTTDSRAQPPATRTANRGLPPIAIAAALAILLVTALLSVRFGSRSVGFGDVLDAVTGHTDGFNAAAISRRIPRTVLAILVGAALAVSGLVMQAVTRNPLADPGILGVNMGATLAIVIGMAYFGLGTAAEYIWVAIAGSAITAVFVYAVGSLGRGGATPLKLALSGAAISAALSSLVIAVVLPRNDIAGGVRSWQIGGVGGATWDSLRLVLPFLLVGFTICWLMARGLNTLALGDEVAAGLGERVASTRLIASFGAVVLCGAATAIAGPIAFVGLVIPHACRLVLGIDHRWTIPMAAILGAVLLTCADLIGRVITADTEVAAGIVTSIVGAPVFIALVRRRRIRSL